MQWEYLVSENATQLFPHILMYWKAYNRPWRMIEPDACALCEEIRQWCANEFGKQGCRWDYTGNRYPVVFRFVNPRDSLHFRVRWTE